jgi:hypothetical protein
MWDGLQLRGLLVFLTHKKLTLFKGVKMDQLKQFIGKKFSSVNDQITDIANRNGITSVYPWPNGIGGYEVDDKTLVVFINNDIEELIVRFE